MVKLERVMVKLWREEIKLRKEVVALRSGVICVIGEATVRLGPTLVSELLSKIEAIKRSRPDLLRRRIVKVIYADYAAPEALEAAKKAKVWVLKWEKDLTPLAVEESW
jgi:hypothetical protein